MIDALFYAYDRKYRGGLRVTLLSRADGSRYDIVTALDAKKPTNVSIHGGKTAANFNRVAIVKNNASVYTSAPGKREAEFTWTDMDPQPGTAPYFDCWQTEDTTAGRRKTANWYGSRRGGSGTNRKRVGSHRNRVSLVRPRCSRTGNYGFAANVERGDSTAIAAESRRDLRRFPGAGDNT